MKKGISILALLAGGLTVLSSSAGLLAYDMNLNTESQQTTVSEPSSLAILGIGLLGLGLIVRHRK